MMYLASAFSKILEKIKILDEKWKINRIENKGEKHGAARPRNGEMRKARVGNDIMGLGLRDGT
jgi:hypothetical protein